MCATPSLLPPLLTPAGSCHAPRLRSCHTRLRPGGHQAQLHVRCRQQPDEHAHHDPAFPSKSCKSSKMAGAHALQSYQPARLAPTAQPWMQTAPVSPSPWSCMCAQTLLPPLLTWTGSCPATRLRTCQSCMCPGGQQAQLRVSCRQHMTAWPVGHAHGPAFPFQTAQEIRDGLCPCLAELPACAAGSYRPTLDANCTSESTTVVVCACVQLQHCCRLC